MSKLISFLVNPDESQYYSNHDWHCLIREARVSSLIGRVAFIIQSYQLNQNLPDEINRHFQSACIFVARQHQAVKQEAHELQRLLAGKNLTPLYLKGAAYILEGSPAAIGRTVSDIDILLKKEQIAQVEGLLIANGWVHSEISDYDEKYYRVWAHEIPPLTHPVRGTTLDVHHNIFPVVSKLSPNANRIYTAAITGMNNDYKTLSAEDKILHSATHLFMEGEFDKGLRDLHDLKLMLDDYRESENWQHLIMRAYQIGLNKPLFYALCACNQIFQSGYNIPPFYSANKLLNHLFKLVLIPHHSSCQSPFFGFAKFVLFIRGHIVKMPMNILIPHLIKKALKNVKGGTKTS